MAFDKTLPTNSTKIRNYPTVLTDNFAAIQEGDLSLTHWQVNFIERNAVPGAPPPAVNPTRQDDTMIIFSKQDGSGETELFAMDDRNPANIIQLTEDGALGSFSTVVKASSIEFSSTATFNANLLVKAWAKVAAGGGIVDGFGFDSFAVNLGTYSGILSDNVVSNANFAVVSGLGSGGTLPRTLRVSSQQYGVVGPLKGNFSVVIRDASGNVQTQEFSVIVMGT